MNRIGVLLFVCVAMFSCDDKRQSATAETVSFISSLDSLSFLIETSGASKELLLQRAKEYQSLGFLDSALADVNQKITFGAEQNDYLLKGNLLLDMHEFENANNAYRQCITEDPENARCYLQLAQIKQLLGYYNTAISLVDSALFIDKTIPEAYFLKGFSFELRKAIGDSTKAISSYQTAVELDPDYFDSYIRLGLLHASKKDSLAISYYQSAINSKPQRIEGWYNQAIYFQENGYLDRAMDNYDEILKIDPQSYLAHYNQGYLLLVHAEQFNDAKAKFDLALTYEPNYVDAYYNRALCSFYLKDYGTARKDCQAALKLDPQYDKAALLMSEMDNL